jgi:hypothetical protein
MAADDGYRRDRRLRCDGGPAAGPGERVHRPRMPAEKRRRKVGYTAGRPQTVRKFM